MNENINLCEILKDCPKGTKFYSTIFGEETYFIKMDPYQGNPRPIVIHGKDEGMVFNLSRFGHPYADSCGECCLWPSKDVRTWEGWKCPKPKFDPKTLKPFDKVLVRDKCTSWLCGLFTCIGSSNQVMATGRWDYVVPYNDDTKHLVGTSDEAPGYYRYWED